MNKTRRHFIKNSAAGALGGSLSFFFPMELLAAMRKQVSPNDRIQVGLIGSREWVSAIFPPC